MPTISRFYGILIQMFYDEKHGPHFHATYGEDKASIGIGSGKIIAGNLPPHARRLVLEWAKQYQTELLENWERARREEPLKPIAPLK